jgi:hypothetical protein
MDVSLKKTRYVPYESNIPYSKDSFYRAIGDEGLERILASREITPGPKFAAKPGQEVFYSRGKAEVDYVDGKRAPIVEAKANSKLVHGPSTNAKLPDHYSYTTSKKGNLTLDDRVRVWARDAVGAPHRVVYDNYSPHKYYGRKGLAAVSKLGPVAGLAAPLIADYDPGVYETRFGYKPESLPATVGLTALGYASDVGDVATAGLAGRYLYQDGPQANPVDDASAVYNAIRKYVGDLFK